MSSEIKQGPISGQPGVRTHLELLWRDVHYVCVLFLRRALPLW